MKKQINYYKTETIGKGKNNTKCIFKVELTDLLMISAAEEKRLAIKSHNYYFKAGNI